MSCVKNERTKADKTLISIVIPAYKQESTIVKDLIRIQRVLDQIRYDYEIIVVVDGMLDKTFEKAKKLASSKCKVIGYLENRGKGYAIRYGMIRSRGDIVGFIDAGMDINPNGLSMLLEHFEWYDAHIIVGSKRHPVSKIKYPFDRKIISSISQVFIRLLFGLNLRDTQVGMKFFRRSVLKKVLPRLVVKKFAFDIEILVVSHYLGFKRIYEAPIELNWNTGTGITAKNLWRVILLTLIDTLAIFYRLKILKYYAKVNKREWKSDLGVRFRLNLGKVSSIL